MSRLRPLLADHRVRLLLIAAIAVGGYFLLKALLPDIDLQEILDDIARTLGDWTYVVVGALAFLETGAFVGLVAPGETFVILGGAVAGVGETSVILTLAIVWFSAWAGDSVSFLLGHRLGREFILRHGPRVRITKERFMQVEGYFDRHGGKTILVGRFVGLVRALAPFIAGSSGMPYRAFVPFSILGTGLWTATFVLLGYFGARSLDKAAEIAGRGTLLFGITVGLIVAVVATVRFLRVPENRERTVARMDANPVLRPLVVLGRRVKPQAQFLWRRVTPGPLGLEFTALLAALAVGLFVVVGFAVLVSGDPAPTPGDEQALRVVREVHAPFLTNLALAVTELGAAYVVYSLALLAAILLSIRRHFAEAAVLLVAMAITFVAVDVLKEVVDRPRPADQLTDASGLSYPSGHAAYSIFYIWAAVTIAFRLEARALGTRLTVRGLVIAIGFLVAAAIGLTRVYLRVHYFSDVSGGWALGISAFALCGLVAIFVSHMRRPELRQNERATRLAAPDPP